MVQYSKGTVPGCIMVECWSRPKALDENQKSRKSYFPLNRFISRQKISFSTSSDILVDDNLSHQRQIFVNIKYKITLRRISSNKKRKSSCKEFSIQKRNSYLENSRKFYPSLFLSRGIYKYVLGKAYKTMGGVFLCIYIFTSYPQFGGKSIILDGRPY